MCLESTYQALDHISNFIYTICLSEEIRKRTILSLKALLDIL
jgi:hypothetical protein